LFSEYHFNSTEWLFMTLNSSSIPYRVDVMFRPLLASSHVVTCDGPTHPPFTRKLRDTTWTSKTPSIYP
jgi:hypothetical protein